MIDILLLVLCTILMVMVNKNNRLNKELDDKNKMINNILNDELHRQNKRTRKD